MRDGLAVLARGRRASGETDRNPGRYRRGYDERRHVTVWGSVTPGPDGRLTLAATRAFHRTRAAWGGRGAGAAPSPRAQLPLGREMVPCMVKLKVSLLKLPKQSAVP